MLSSAADDHLDYPHYPPTGIAVMGRPHLVLLRPDQLGVRQDRDYSTPRPPPVGGRGSVARSSSSGHAESKYPFSSAPPPKGWKVKFGSSGWDLIQLSPERLVCVQDGPHVIRLPTGATEASELGGADHRSMTKEASLPRIGSSCLDGLARISDTVFATASYDRKVRVFDLKSVRGWEKDHSLASSDKAALSPGWVAEGSLPSSAFAACYFAGLRVLAGACSSKILLWDVEKGMKSLGSFHAFPKVRSDSRLTGSCASGPTFEAEDETLLYYCSTGSVVCVDVKDRLQVAKFDYVRPFAAVVSGYMLAGIGTEGNIAFFDRRRSDKRLSSLDLKERDGLFWTRADLLSETEFVTCDKQSCFVVSFGPAKPSVRMRWMNIGECKPYMCCAVREKPGKVNSELLRGVDAAERHEFAVGFEYASASAVIQCGRSIKEHHHHQQHGGAAEEVLLREGTQQKERQAGEEGPEIYRIILNTGGFIEDNLRIPIGG